MSEPDGIQDFTAGCRTVVRLLALQDERPLDPAEDGELAAAWSTVTGALPAFLRPPPSGLRLERADLAQEAMARFVKAAAAGRIRQAESPAGYLMTIAANIVNSALRKVPPPTPYADPGTARAVDPPPLDQTIALLDRLASEDTVRDGLERAREAEDWTTVAVIGAWLDAARWAGGQPSIRGVAELAGVSHTTVQRCLQRFREYLGPGSTE